MGAPALRALALQLELLAKSALDDRTPLDASAQADALLGKRKAVYRQGAGRMPSLSSGRDSGAPDDT